MTNSDSLSLLRHEIQTLGEAFLPLCAAQPAFKVLPELLFKFTDMLEFVNDQVEELTQELEAMEKADPYNFMTSAVYQHLNGRYYALVELMLNLENAMTAGEEIARNEGLD